MKWKSSWAAAAAFVVLSGFTIYVGPGGGVSSTSEAIGSSTRPFVLATPFFQPKSGTNNTLHITNMDDVAISFNTRRYGADGTLLSSSITTIQDKATVITFAGANLGAQMHIEVWAATPHFTVEVFFTDASDTVHKIQHGDMLQPRGGGSFQALSPFRVCDTRQSGPNCPAGKVPAGGEIAVQFAGVGGVLGTGVSAVTFNLTVTGGTSTSYLTAWPDGATKPVASTLNFSAGQTIANMVTVKLGSNGKIRVANSLGQAHVILDVAGYYA